MSVQCICRLVRLCVFSQGTSVYVECVGTLTRTWAHGHILEGGQKSMGCREWAICTAFIWEDGGFHVFLFHVGTQNQSIGRGHCLWTVR